MPDPSPNFPAIRMQCAGPDQAIRFADYLRGEQIDVRAVEDRTVVIPTDSPMLAYALAESANEGGYAHDDAAAASVVAFLRSIGADQ